MINALQHKHQGKFFLTIILPTALAIILSIVSIYLFIIPAFKQSFIENKKEMIRELTNVAWNILLYYEDQEQNGYITRWEAQRKAKNEIRRIRYGEENKDYFFIIDTHPRMIMHPYSPELEGEDLSSHLDSNNTPLFVEMKKLAEEKQGGFLNYSWHTKYDYEITVPKLSYVRKFTPWNWIVGTGVFLDDVDAKTVIISRKMSFMVLLTALIFSILLLVVALQSFRIEKKRRVAEEKLHLSHEKYKALAETATDPMIMVHNNKILYANKSMCSLLNLSENELNELTADNLFPEDRKPDESGIVHYYAANSGKLTDETYEGLLQDRQGNLINTQLSFSGMMVGHQKCIVMTAIDTREELTSLRNSQSRADQFGSLAEALNIGTFEVKNDSGLTFEEANDSALQIFEISPSSEISDHKLSDYFQRQENIEELLATFKQDSLIKSRSVPLFVSEQKKSIYASLSLAPRKNDTGETEGYFGTIEDISSQKKTEHERENLIVELQTSLLFLNQPIKFSLKNFVSCGLNTTVSAATKIMAQEKQSSILVSGTSGEMIGIITDMVLRERVIAENLPYDTPVYQVMSSPLIYIDDTALIFEAVLLMQEKNIKHLVVRNSDGKTLSVISNEELLHVHRYSTSFLISQIKEAARVEDLFSIQDRLPRIVKSLADSGAHAKNITRIITTISDTILERIIDFAIEEMGEPPKRFCFFSLGSEGRGEQTLVTDQDNALIFEDCSEDELEDVLSYFHEFGTKICTWLDQAGYFFCKGEIMAMNPKWCMPISSWKDAFTGWIQNGSPQDLLEVNIFFDFRGLYGDLQFTKELRDHVVSFVESKAPFLQHLSFTSLSFRPPVDFFGNIQGETGDESNRFDIKKVLACIVGFARVYAIENGLETTNTIQRIEQLHKKNIINDATYEEILDSYDYLMKLRFNHQVKLIDQGKTPDNLITIDTLNHMDKVMVKKAFSQITSIQKRLSYDFSGQA